MASPRLAVGGSVRSVQAPARVDRATPSASSRRTAPAIPDAAATARRAGPGGTDAEESDRRTDGVRAAVRG